MKRILLIPLMILLVAACASAQYSNPSQVVNSFHDLSMMNTNTHVHFKAVTFTEVCAFCHTPHQGKSTTDALVTDDSGGVYPLWNHKLSANTFTPYMSSSMPVQTTQFLGNDGANTTVSALCLSCHDGTVGLNTIYNGEQNTTGGMLGSVAPYAKYSPWMSYWSGTAYVTVGTEGSSSSVFMGQSSRGFTVGTSTGSLQNEHPVSFSYTAARAINANLKAPVTGSSGLGLRRGVVTKDGSFLPLYTYSSTGLTDAMECGTCHDVHDQSTHSPFLRASNQGSELCLACHGTTFGN